MEAHKPQSGITALFFILWIFLGCFVVVNMTVGVVVDTFSQIKAENDGLLLMSEDAADWVKAQKQVFATRPLKQDAPPAAPWRLNVYYVVTSTKFELAIMCDHPVQHAPDGLRLARAALPLPVGGPTQPETTRPTSASSRTRCIRSTSPSSSSTSSR